MLALCLTGCQTVSKSSPFNLSEPGWRLQQGQALWRSKKEAPEIAGEIVLATNANGRAFVQFLKNPLPLVTAEIGPLGWHVEFIPKKRSFSGRGRPPGQLIWLQLLRGLEQGMLPRYFQFSKAPDGGTHIENNRTGESITLFLNDG